MPPPNRTNNAAYHFHAYDYDSSAARGPWQLCDAQPNRNGWQFYSMVQDLAGLRAYGAGTTHVPNIALTDVGGPIGMGPTRKYTKQLSFGGVGPAPPSIVITGGIHAREWIAAEFVYLLAEYLIMHYAAHPANRYEQALRNLIDSRRICIIPMLNPDGNRFTVFGADPNDRFWRKNRRALPGAAATWVNKLTTPAGVARVPNQPFQNVQLHPPPPPGMAEYRVPNYSNTAPPGAPVSLTRTLENGKTGVDLNRNVDTAGWGYECVPASTHPNYSPASDTYFGPDRGSETETGNLQTALTAAAPVTLIDYHAYGKYILYPSELATRGAVDTSYEILGREIQELIRAQGVNGPDYQLGTPFDLVHYNATGTVTDRAGQVNHARAFTIELDPANTGQGLAGFDLNENQIRMVFEKNIRGALAAIASRAAPANPVAAFFTRYTIGTFGTIEFMDWNVYGRGNRLPV